MSIAVKPTSSIRTAARVDRPRRPAHHGGDPRPPRPVRRHPRHADRRGDAGAGGDGPCAAPPRAVRRRERRGAADPPPRVPRRRRCSLAAIGAVRRPMAPIAAGDAGHRCAVRARCRSAISPRWARSRCTRRCGSSDLGFRAGDRLDRVAADPGRACSRRTAWAWHRRPQRARSRAAVCGWPACCALAVVRSALAFSGRYGGAAVSICVALLFIANGAVIPLMEASLAHHLNLRGGRDAAGAMAAHACGVRSASWRGAAVRRAAAMRWASRAWPWLVLLLWVLLAAVAGACRRSPRPDAPRRGAGRARWPCCAGPRWRGSSPASSSPCWRTPACMRSSRCTCAVARHERDGRRPAVGGGRAGRDRLLLDPGPLVRAAVDAQTGCCWRRSRRRCASRAMAAFGDWMRGAGADADDRTRSRSRPSTPPASRWCRPLLPGPAARPRPGAVHHAGLRRLGRDRRRGRRRADRALGLPGGVLGRQRSRRCCRRCACCARGATRRWRRRRLEGWTRSGCAG